MKKIPLTKGMFALVDDEDYDSLNQWKWRVTCGEHKFYAVRNGEGRRNIIMHRVILNICDPKILVDHKDGDGLNNTRNNLRVATKGQNRANSKAHGSSKYLGVSWSKRDCIWRSGIKVNGKTKHLGTYSKETDAAIAYNDEAIKSHGEFANLNKV